MVSQIVTPVLQVTLRTTRNGRTVYDVACGDGTKRTVWEDALAASLQSYAGTGQPLTLNVDVEQNGQYTNHTIKQLVGIATAGAATPQPPLTPAGAPAPIPQPFIGANTAPIQAAPAGGDKFPPEATTRITKLAAIHYASVLVGSLMQGAGPEAIPEALEAVQTVSRRFYVLARSHEQEQGSTPLTTALSPQGGVVPTQQVATAGTTPQEIAASVPGVTVGAPVQAPVAQGAVPAGDDVSWG